MVNSCAASSLLRPRGSVRESPGLGLVSGLFGMKYWSVGIWCGLLAKELSEHIQCRDWGLWKGAPRALEHDLITGQDESQGSWLSLELFCVSLSPVDLLMISKVICGKIQNDQVGSEFRDIFFQ